MTNIIILSHRAFIRPARIVLEPMIDGRADAALVTHGGTPVGFAVLRNAQNISRVQSLRGAPLLDILYSNLKLHLAQGNLPYLMQRGGIYHVTSISKDKTSLFLLSLRHLEAFGLPPVGEASEPRAKAETPPVPALV